MAMWALAAYTAVTVLSQLKEGAQEKAGKKGEALQLEQNAGQEKAYAQRRSIEERKQANLLGSKVQAVGASSGASGVDLENIIGDIAGEGEMRAMTRIYEGDERSRSLHDQAGAARRAGQRAATASYWKAGATVLGSIAGAYGGSGGSTLWDKYSGGVGTGQSNSILEMWG